jgi:hypothetical protein
VGRRASVRNNSHPRPSLAQAAAVWRAWLDCTAPAVSTVSAPRSRASPSKNSSLRVLLPPAGEPRAVVALDPDPRPAKLATEALEWLEGGRQVRQA